jgi:hypothetical protein
LKIQGFIYLLDSGRSLYSRLFLFCFTLKMMRHLVVFWVLLFDIRYAGVQAQTAIWKFPTQGEGLQANTIDTVLLDWTSTLPSTILRMWCQNGTDGGNFALGASVSLLRLKVRVELKCIVCSASSFYVDSTGPFKYVMETYEPNETAFPLSCHAELAADPLGSGFDSPAGIVWSSDSAQAAKTISQTQAASSVTVTVVSTPSPSSTPTSVPPSTTGSTTTDSLSQSTTPTPSTKQPTTLSTKSSESPSGATTASQPSTSASPNNTGAIVGGAIGCVALLSFIILALLFLRKYQRDRASSSSIAAEPSKRGFYLFNVYKKRGAKARITGVFEKEGDYGAYEKEGTRLSHGGGVQEKEGSGASRWGQVHELQGIATWKKTMSRGESWAGGEEDHAMRYSPVELPGGSN